MLKNALSAKLVASVGPGKYRDGEGLQFEVKGGSRRWTFTYSMHGKAREIPIGGYPSMSLADARAKRAELRDAKDRGLDPLTVLRGKPVKGSSLEDDVTRFVKHMEGQWSREHRAEWLNSIDRVAGDLLPRQTHTLQQDDILAVLRPVWTTQNITATRVLKRIEAVINHATAVDPKRFAGLTNPCLNLTVHLPRVAAKVEPRPAVPWRELPAFFATLKRRPEPAAAALEFLILTCCPRAGEITQAEWSEIAGDRWNVPAEHMKSGRARTIPLSPAALECLGDIEPKGDRIFNIHSDGMQAFMRDVLKLPYTVHGFRSSFMDWVAECHPSRLMEAERALDHAIGNAVQRAYLRTDLLDQRRELATLWAEFLDG